MNRFKKEEARKHAEARKGLSPQEIEILDTKEALERLVHEKARELHAEQFPEEYDFMSDTGLEAKERRQGINPMRQEYRDEVNARRAARGVPPLTENGMAADETAFELCKAEATRLVYADPAVRRPPSPSCIFCDKTLEEVGGRRLVAQHDRCVSLSKRRLGGGDPNYPQKSVKLYEDLDTWLVVQAKKGRWTDELIETARRAFQQGRRPWFCQVCGGRTCYQCGAPMNIPVGSDCLYGDGSTARSPILGVNPGCMNPECDNYKPRRSS